MSDPIFLGMSLGEAKGAIKDLYAQRDGLRREFEEKTRLLETVQQENQRLREFAAVGGAEIERLKGFLETVERHRQEAEALLIRSKENCRQLKECFDVANLQVRELTETARELVENDGAGADYDASKAHHARERLRKLLYSEKRETATLTLSGCGHTVKVSEVLCPICGV